MQLNGVRTASEVGAGLVLWVALVPLLNLVSLRQCGSAAYAQVSRLGCLEESAQVASACTPVQTCAEPGSQHRPTPRCCICLRLCDLTMLAAPSVPLATIQSSQPVAWPATAPTLDAVGQPPSPPPKSVFRV
jgi:hypothetical protein